MGEANAAIGRLAEAQVDGQPILVGIDGVPSGEPPAYRLSDAARNRLADRTAHLRTTRGRWEVALAWARHRGRVSTTEVRALCDLSQPAANSMLNSLETQGLLGPGRDNKVGRGFFYIPVEQNQ